MYVNTENPDLKLVVETDDVEQLRRMFFALYERAAVLQEEVAYLRRRDRVLLGTVRRQEAAIARERSDSYGRERLLRDRLEIVRNASEIEGLALVRDRLNVMIDDLQAEVRPEGE
jgi:hypothetical protein